MDSETPENKTMQILSFYQVNTHDPFCNFKVIWEVSTSSLIEAVAILKYLAVILAREYIFVGSVVTDNNSLSSETQLRDCFLIGLQRENSLYTVSKLSQPFGRYDPDGDLSPIYKVSFS